MSGTLILSWGHSGGVYLLRRPRFLRLCVGPVAFTWYGYDVDDVLRAGLDTLEPSA